MAVGAQTRRDGMRTCQLESGCGVVERSVCPLHGVVAGFAGRGESGCNVVHWRRCTVVIGLMA